MDVKEKLKYVKVTDYYGRKIIMFESVKGMKALFYQSSGQNAEKGSVWPIFGITDKNYAGSYEIQCRIYEKLYRNRTFPCNDGWIFKLHRDRNDICSYWNNSDIRDICWYLERNEYSFSRINYDEMMREIEELYLSQSKSFFQGIVARMLLEKRDA